MTRDRAAPADRKPSGEDAVQARLAMAVRVAEEAGQTALGFFARRDALTVERKSAAQDLVSEADREVEDQIRQALSAAFPDDGQLGEERGRSAGRSGFTWVIDPIDGTSPFVFGQPNWCVSIALLGPERIELGVIHAPVLRETYVAARGRGATLNGRALRVDAAWTIASANVAFGADHKADPAASAAFVQGLYGQGGVMFRIGSGALMLAYVAAGRLAGYYDPNIHVWDCYAGIVIVEEAGGEVDYRGCAEPAAPGPLWAGPSGVVASMKALSPAS